MKNREPSLLWRAVCMACLLLPAMGTAFAQTPGGVLRGQITDPSGGVVAGATVLLTTPSGASMDIKTNKDGIYEFKDLPPGTYDLKAVAEGFSLLTKTGVVVTAGQVTRVNLQLSIEVQQEKVEVQANTAQVDTNPTNNANSITLQGKDLEALSDDPDELQSELQALAGPSAGPNGGQIYIDGFTAGQLPPKASIREIRINQNPFSSEYDKLGYGRIEIYTKPGTDKLHGQLMMSGNDSAFNARNPFEILPNGEAPPSYHSEQYSGNIGGALTKKASFFVNFERRDIEALNVVNATVLCGSTGYPCPTQDSPFTPILYSASVDNPQTRTNVSPRIDYQLTPGNTLTARYQYWRDMETNNGVGQFDLAEVGNNTHDVEHTVQLTDTQTVSPTTINEARFQFVRETSLLVPVNGTVNILVQGAFSGNGSGGGNNSETENRYEFQDIVYKNFGKHSLKFGGRLRAANDYNATAEDFAGTFTFGSRVQPGCTVTATETCIITAITAYQNMQMDLAQGMSIVQIQQAGYGPSYYSQTAGVPGLTVTLVDAGIFAQDDWKLRPNLTVSYGLRFETQNNFSDKRDFAPRIGFAWGLGGSAKKPPKTVLRAGFGLFYDRFTYSLLEDQERYNLAGTQQQQYLIQNPNFYLTGNPTCVPPFATVPPPSECGGTSSSIPNLYAANSNLHAPYVIQTGVTLERQITKVSNVAVTYLNSRGVHQFYTDNINPIDPEDPTAPRPMPTEGNIFQFESEGIFKQNQLIVNGSIRMGTKLSLFGYYTLSYAKSDTGGPTSFPSIPGEPWTDYGRSPYDIRNRVFMGGTIGLPYAFRLSPFLTASSGVPFNITTGSDLYQDSLYNVRPAFGACSAATQTKYGCFDAAPSPGYTQIPIYYGDGPGRFALMLRLSKTFGFGPVVESSGGGGGMGGGTFGRGPGRGPGGPGGRGGWDAGATNRRYAVTFSIMGRNVFNNVNTLAPIGDLSSPMFGESNGLAGRPYSDTSSNRRLDLQVSFTF